MNKQVEQMILVDKIMPQLMELSDILWQEMGSISINVNGGKFVYIADENPQYIPISEQKKLLERVGKEVIEGSLESPLLPNGQKLELLNYSKVRQSLNKLKEEFK
jgi:hypothetical protein